MKQLKNGTAVVAEAADITYSEADHGWRSGVQVWVDVEKAFTLTDLDARRLITKLAFRNRFTTAEKVALELASLDNPAATSAQRQAAAALRVSLKDQENATFIDLDRSDTRAGVQMLETAGLLGTGRATVILDSPVLAQEVYTTH